METNDSNIKPQQTGGLKLMTVFIAVLALHVVVIGGFSAYYLLKGGSADSDLVSDKTHKDAKVATDTATASDGQMPEAAPSDKTASAPTADNVSGPLNIPAPATEQTASTENSEKPATPSTTTTTAVTPAPRGPVITPSAAPSKPVVATTVAPAPAITPDAQPPVTINGAPYVVKQGDSLAKIARRNHTSVAKLKAANNLPNDMLHIGQKMVIPAKAQVVTTAPATNASGSTTILSDSVATPSMNVAAAPVATPATATAHEQAAPAATTHGRTYTVVKGDTLTKIAHKFKTTPTAIMTANNLTDATKLGIGKKLKIPAQESRSATNNEPAPQPQPQPAQAQPKADTTAQLANFIP